MQPSQTVNVDEFVETARFGRFHLRVLVIATLIMMIDGYDLYLVGWILPSLADDYGVDRTDLTPVLMIQQIGMLIGGYFVAPFADRIGRRNLLMIATAAVGLSCLGTMLANNVAEFTVWRVITGIFAGAIVPNLISMTSEIAPKKYRGLMPTIVLTGAMGGAFIGAAMQGFVLEDYGWHGAFWIGGLLPLLMLPIIYFMLPESLSFLVRKRPGDARISTIARQISPDLPEGTVLVEPAVAQGGKPKSAIGDILSGNMLARSLLLWTAFLCSFMFISLYASWSTTIYHDMVGLDWQQVAVATTVNTVFGMIGTLLAGILIDRLSFNKVVPLFMFGAALSIIMIGIMGSGMAMLVAIGAKSMFQAGGQGGLASFAPTVYPPRVKATGVGWSYGAGRIGAMLAPLIGAILLEADLPTTIIFAAMSVPLLLAGIFVFITTRLVKAAEQ